MFIQSYVTAFFRMCIECYVPVCIFAGEVYEHKGPITLVLNVYLEPYMYIWLICLKWASDIWIEYNINPIGELSENGRAKDQKDAIACRQGISSSVRVQLSLSWRNLISKYCCIYWDEV